jgi:biopolymer transport protein ExbB
MKTKIVRIFATFVAAAVISVPALAQDAKSLDELLQMIESASISESADSKGREAAFKSDQRKQGQLLKNAQNTKVQEERRSDRLEQKNSRQRYPDRQAA